MSTTARRRACRRRGRLPRNLATAFALGCAAPAATAAPFTSFDPSLMATGGAGVALDNARTAPLYNPAALAAAPARDRFAGTVAGGARLYDPGNLLPAIADFERADYTDAVDDAIAQLEDHLRAGTPEASDVVAVGTAIEALNDGLISVGNRLAQGEYGSSLVLSRPGGNTGLAITVSQWAAFGGDSTYSDGDLLDRVAGDMIRCGSKLEAGDSCDAADFESFTIDADGSVVVAFDPAIDLQSEVRARGIVVRSTGLSLAQAVSIQGNATTFGLTLKRQSITVVDYASKLVDLDDNDIDDPRFRRSETSVNVDFGLLTELAPGWSAGLFVRNAIPQDFSTRLGNTIAIEPQTRAGLARQGEHWRVTADVDVVPNDPVQLGEKTQFLGLGAEADVSGWLTLRAGYRHNFPHNERDVLTTGVGLQPTAGVQLDAAAIGGRAERGLAVRVAAGF